MIFTLINFAAHVCSFHFEKPTSYVINPSECVFPVFKNNSNAGQPKPILKDDAVPTRFLFWENNTSYEALTLSTRQINNRKRKAEAAAAAAALAANDSSSSTEKYDQFSISFNEKLLPLLLSLNIKFNKD